MSTAHGLFVPESNSKALFPTAPSSKPTSEIIPHTCHINHEHPEEEQQEEEIIIPTITTAAAAAAVVSVSVTLDTEENNKEAKDVTVEFCDDSEDDGYHTPTSPRHRIPVDMKHPPPPPKKKKSSSRLLYAKRKERTARARVRVDIDGEISSFLCVGLLDETSRRKKAKTF
uniref:Uncharacterized protein n=1 Tax=Ananas comosus var. bracteatus TaxID=296719 RepID=A0A6V7QYA2_ANACO